MNKTRLRINKNLISLTVPLLINFFLFSILVNKVWAQENLIREQSQEPGVIEGIGTYFSIINSDYLNITLTSSEIIKLRMESIPEMIRMLIEPASSVTSTQITIGGLAPLTTYYKYENDYHNLVQFTTDQNGSYSYLQDLSKPHVVFIQPRKSTKFIVDNITGGDCILIGNWDWSTKTCSLTRDINETIQIDSDNITIEGNNHIISGNRTGSGIYLFGRNNIVIKNLTIQGFTDGISMFFTNNSLIENVNIVSNTVGLNVRSANENTFRKNTITNNRFGVWLGWYFAFYESTNNKFYNNNFINTGPFETYFVLGSAVGNVFSLPPPIGGNYWARYDTPEEGCFDINNDNFCDSPYYLQFPNVKDDFPWVKRNGWLNQPPTLSNLNQYKSDGLTRIQEGGITTESSIDNPYNSLVVFKATLNDPDNDNLKLQIELKPFNQPFDETEIIESNFVPSGSIAIVTKNGLIEGKYKWRARAIDYKGNVSNWQEFGTAGNVDFEVKLVPLYTQIFSPYPSEDETRRWFNEPYAEGGNYDCGSTIGQCGCAITSIVMIARYYGVTEAQGGDVNPLEINNWLRNQPDGYINGNVNWIAAARYTNWRIKYERTDTTINNYALLDEYLNKNQPVIAKEINPDHFIVIDNKLATTYDVKDPAWYNTRKLDEALTSWADKIRDYNNNFYGLRIYKKGDGIAQSSITITLGSPAELLIIDPQGRKLGKDANGIEYSEIPNGWYFEDGFDDPSGKNPPLNDRSKVLQILEPIDGLYQVQVVGIGQGRYSLEFNSYDTQGNLNHQEFYSEIAPGYVAQYNLYFDSTNSNNISIKVFDKTSPETEIFFDPIIKKLIIKGTDNTTVNPNVSLISVDNKQFIYNIKDEAGNTTKIFFKKLQQEGKEIKAELESIQYNNQSVITFPKTELQYEWSIYKKTGTIKNLEQRIKVKDQFEIKARYNSEKNETSMKVKIQYQEEQEQTLPGLVIIKLITNSGNLNFRF